MNVSKPALDSTNQVTYNCSLMLNITLNNEDTISPIFSYVLMCLSCPLIIMLNTLTIVVVAKKKTLQNNLNILFCSMAVADLLVGAVYQPLAIASGALYFKKHDISGIQCTLDETATILLGGACTCSIFHLTIIAWQRHARIGLDLVNNPENVSRRRIKILIFISWMTALISTIPAVMISTGVNFQYGAYLDSCTVFVIFICCILTIYYYISIYIKTRKIKIELANENASQTAEAKLKMEKAIAFTTGLLTLAVFIFYTPSSIVFFCYLFPVFCKSSYIIWAITLIQLSSLANPALYCYRNCQLRAATLELLGMGAWGMPLAVAHGRRNRSHPNNIPLQGLQGLQGIHIRERSKSWDPNNFNNVHLDVQRRHSVV